MPRPLPSMGLEAVGAGYRARRRHKVKPTNPAAAMAAHSAGSGTGVMPPMSSLMLASTLRPKSQPNSKPSDVAMSPEKVLPTAGSDQSDSHVPGPDLLDSTTVPFTSRRRRDPSDEAPVPSKAAEDIGC